MRDANRDQDQFPKPGLTSKVLINECIIAESLIGIDKSA
jgi:hypothetical protein